MSTVEGSNAKTRVANQPKRACVGENRSQLYPRVTIHTLPDNALLEIFKFHVDKVPNDGTFPDDEWHALVHVCQRWRSVVLASPRRLDLHIVCTNVNQVEKDLNIWPQLPIAIEASSNTSPLPGVPNIVAALKHHHRVGKINLCGAPNSLLKEFGAMKTPFPALTELRLRSSDVYPLVLPDSFLLGSAPSLRTLRLNGIPFPALPKLFLSTSNLVELDLWDIPPSGYISPEALTTSLSVLTKLNSLSLTHEFPPPWTDRANPHPLPFMRVILPSLHDFSFDGHSEYLERIVSQIEGRLLEYTWIKFSDQLPLALDRPQFRHFISRTKSFQAPHRVDIEFFISGVRVGLFWRKGIVDCKRLELKVPCSLSSWQISAITHVCSSTFPLFPTLDRLSIYESRFMKSEWKDNIVNTQWLQLFHPFSSVKNLFLSEKLVQVVAPALQELTGGRVTEVLPALQNLFLRGPETSETVQEAIGQFIDERKLSDCPVAVHCERNDWW